MMYVSARKARYRAIVGAMRSTQENYSSQIARPSPKHCRQPFESQLEPGGRACEAKTKIALAGWTEGGTWCDTHLDARQDFSGECEAGGALQERGSAAGVELDELVGDLLNLARRHHPAKSPTGHRPSFGEAVDGHH